MKISIEVHEEGRTLYETHGRKRHVCEAKLGDIEVSGANKSEAAAAMKTALLTRALAPRPVARVLKDGRCAVAYLDGASEDGSLGYSIQLFYPDGRMSGGMGANLHGCSLTSSPREVADAVKRALDNYCADIDAAL